MRRCRARPDEYDIIDRDATPDYDAVRILKAKLYPTFSMPRDLPTFATDFIVKCGNCSWRFHKDTFAKKLDYFRDIADRRHEANQGVIELSEEEPQLIEAMEALEDLPDDKLDQVLTPLVKSARCKPFKKEQMAKIADLAKVFPALAKI